MSAIYVDVNEFMGLLKSQGLVIVSADEFELAKEIRRGKVMKKRAVSLKEIVDHELLEFKSKKGVSDLILKGKIRETETYRDGEGSLGKVMVLTSAIRRLRNE